MLKQPIYNLEFSAKNSSETSVRSVNSDLEVVPSARKRRNSKNVPASPLSQAAEKTNSNRPASKWQLDEHLFITLDWAFTQQKMYGWQPILTPYNVLPVLFILGIVFVPLGAVFLSASFGVILVDYQYGLLFRSKNSPLIIQVVLLALVTLVKPPLLSLKK